MGVTMGRGRRGGNAIEFALTFPLFLTVLVGLMDYGYLFAMQAGIDNAVSIACREGAMVDPSKGAGLPEATADAVFLDRSAIFCAGVTCDWLATDMKTGAYEPPNRTMKCEVTRPMTSLVGFLPTALYPTEISSTSFYRFEWQRRPE
ncbi:MAG: TadE/TadG family type IV pilus assembly protein [Myxococcota bacterium]